MIFIYRDFAFYDDKNNVNGEIGDISIILKNNNIIEVQIMNLYNDIIQVILNIKYPKNINLYDAVCIILNKISFDLYYKFRNIPQHKDFIINNNTKLKKNNIWSFDTKKNSCGGLWIEFTKENIKYITIENDICNNINGEVFEDGSFIYDINLK